MIARRRCPSPTVPSGETHDPQPSGPRGIIASRMRSSSAASTRGALVPRAMMPAMPHMRSERPVSAARRSLSVHDRILLHCFGVHLSP